MYLASPPEVKNSKPRRKVIKRHIADIIEKMLTNSQITDMQSNEVKEVAQEKAEEIDETCYVRYGSDGKAYTECIKKGLQDTTTDIIANKKSVCDQQFKEMIDNLDALKTILKDVPADSIKQIYGMNASNLSWLIDFIEMIKNRGNLNGVEQNVSIAYCSSFLPIMGKITEKKKADFPIYQSIEDDISFEEPWF